MLPADVDKQNIHINASGQANSIVKQEASSVQGRPASTSKSCGCFTYVAMGPVTSVGIRTCVNLHDYAITINIFEQTDAGREL